jgi:hypothetical protein
MFGDLVVLLPDNIAFGHFYSYQQKQAEAFAARTGGHVVEVDPPCGWLCGWHEPPFSYCPHDGNAIWFNNNWKRPIVHGRFYDLASAIAYRDWYGQGGVGIELEWPEDDKPVSRDDDDEDELVIVWVQQQFRPG